MQKLQDSVFSIIKTTNLSPAVFNFLQPSEDSSDKTPLGGILSDTKHGWLALGPKFCIIDLRSGLKVAARIFGHGSSSRTSVTSVVELPTPLTTNSKQLIISLECDEVTGMICVFHINGSQVLHCIQTDVVVTELAVCDDIPNGPFMCFDGLLMAGTKRGEIFVFDVNRTCLVDALKNVSQGHEDEIHNEMNAANLVFLPLKAIHKIESQRDLAVDNHDHLAVLLNENSLAEGQYIFRNPDGSVRMKAKRDHIRVTVVQYIPQLASLIVGYNFGAFQIWNLLNLELEFTSQVNVECLPVTHFGFQEPCDDPRAFCYLWVVFSVIDRFEEEEFPLAVMYSLTYQGKRMMSESSCLYQEFSTATIRFQIELSTIEETSQFVGGRCVSCHTYSVNSALGDDGDDSMYTNICQLVWECWGEHAGSGAQHGMMLFDLDQWYKDQMPATYRLESNAFMSTSWCSELARGACLTLDVRLDPASAAPYSHATRLEEHFYPNSLQYNCICLNTSEAMVLHTAGIQRQIIASLAAAGPACLLAPARLRAACALAGLAPLYGDACASDTDPSEQRRYLLSVALEARLSSFLKRCAHDWATGTHSASGCTLTFLVDWCWKRAIELKENARELTAPLFTSSTLPDRNIVRCLEHCVQQLTQLTGLLDSVLTKCCNLVVPDALSEMEEKFKGIGTVSLYFQVVQWFLRVGLLPERHDAYTALPYPADQLYAIYKKRRVKLQRLEDKPPSENENESCSLLYIDQLIEHEFGAERTHKMWACGGGERGGLYPPPSLFALLRLYLLPDIAEEHKHSLVLYLLLDYSMVYDDMRYEEVIRRLMQFPTMFGLSNTAIKATQAFWHLDHRDFDFALDQLQCLTGNTLSEWQHNVVLSSLLAQKKTQAALQYLHVRKPAPIQNLRDKDADYRISDQDKLEDWQSCCNLYLARGLVFEALDVIRMCVRSADAPADRLHVINFFFKGCRNTGQLAKVLNVTLLPFEEEMFIKYLQNCNEPQTSDILIMYYLQQARYLEAQQYNNKIKSKGRPKDMSTSVESLLEVMDREGARDTLVEVVCSALPAIAETVARCARTEFEPHIVAPKPMSVYVQARSPKNTFTYKSSFIQDTIENASETWVNKPQMKRGIKRALEVEETPFICTPKLFKTKSLFSEQGGESTPPKRAKLDLSGNARSSKSARAPRAGEQLSEQLAALLDMPPALAPGYKPCSRSGAETPQSILKTRRLEGVDREAPSPVDSRYLGDSDDELLETASNHTQFSDSKHLRFTIPTASEGSSTPSPAHPVDGTAHIYKLERDSDNDDNEEVEISSAVSPPKKLAVEEVKPRKSYKDTVKARRSLSISANSSLSDDPNTSIESIADLPITLINPKYSGEKRYSRERTPVTETEDVGGASERERDTEDMDSSVDYNLPAPKIPQGRRSIRKVETTMLVNRSRSVTPERLDSPIQPGRATRSRTPEVSPRLSPLAPIPELPKQESNSEPHPAATLLSVPRPMRSRSRTPERIDTTIAETRLDPIIKSPNKASQVEAPPRPSSRRSLRHTSKTPERMDKESEVTKLEVIKEAPATSSSTESPGSSPTRRSLRSRSRTPELEVLQEQPVLSPRSLRSRSKTPEKMSPKKETTRSKKSLSRMVLEANTFAKTRQNVENTEKVETEPDVDDIAEEKADNVIECTPMKSSKETPKLMDVTFSPITNKSILQSSTESVFSISTEKMAKTDDDSVTGLKPLPAFTTITETYAEKSVLHSYQSSIVETSSVCVEEKFETSNVIVPNTDYKALPSFNMINETGFGTSVLKSFQSSVAESSMDESRFEKDEGPLKTFSALKSLNETEFGKSVLRSEDSSVAITSDESFAKDNRQGTDTTNKNMSSLITDDSDVEMKDWSQKIDSQETARVIQKEKEKIVEIEREINEMEDDMSNDCRVDDDTDSEDQVEEEESEEESQEDTSESSEAESNNDEEIICIDDSDESSVPEAQVHSRVQSVIVKVTSPSKEEHTKQLRIDDIQTIEVETESDNKNENMEMLDVTEVSTDPLNQAQISMLTDDNSVIESESMNLNYSDEIKPATEEKIIDQEEIDSAPNVVEIEVVVEAIEPPIEYIKENTEISKDIDVVDSLTPTQIAIENIPLPPTNIDKEQIDKSEVIEMDEKNIDSKDTETVVETAVEENIVESKVMPEYDVNKTSVIKELCQDPVVCIVKEKSTGGIEEKHETITEEKAKQETEQLDLATEKVEPATEIVEPATEIVEPATEKVAPIAEKVKPATEKIEPIAEKVKPAPEKVEPIAEKVKLATEKVELTTEKVELATENVEPVTEKVEPATPRRKRTGSTSSTKSSKNIEIPNPVVDEPKTPKSRKRTQSNASNKSVTEDEKSEEVKTPRGRSKTPNTELRKILTRRASRELSEKMDDSEVNPDDVVTPVRRTTRARSKNIDDNASVASEESVKSVKSMKGRVSIDSARKGRRKPDLSVIPEVTSEESGLKEITDDIVDDYSGIRRLTRHQKAVLESWLEPKSVGRRTSVASRSEASLEGDDDDSSHSPAFDVQPLDRITLLNRTDFEGALDDDEIARTESPLSFLSETRPRNRLARSASETNTTPKAARVSRKASADVALSGPPEVGSPAGGLSPGRSRRASFTKACEALQTPKGRRTSIEIKRVESDSPPTSPAGADASPAPAARRPRRVSSTTSTSGAKELGKRSKKLVEKE